MLNEGVTGMYAFNVIVILVPDVIVGKPDICTPKGV
jgi:hypothetical protein